MAVNELGRTRDQDLGPARGLSEASGRDGGSSETPPKPPRSPRIDRRVLVEPLSPKDVENSVIDNKYFVEVTPKSKGERAPYEKGFLGAETRLNGEDSPRDAGASCTRGDSSSPVTAEAKVRNKILQEQMLKNIQDTHNIDVRLSCFLSYPVFFSIIFLSYIVKLCVASHLIGYSCLYFVVYFCKGFVIC